MAPARFASAVLASALAPPERLGSAPTDILDTAAMIVLLP